MTYKDKASYESSPPCSVCVCVRVYKVCVCVLVEGLIYSVCVWLGSTRTSSWLIDMCDIDMDDMTG